MEGWRLGMLIYEFRSSRCGAEHVRSGRSAAWLARLVRDQEVEGSNPFAPTISFQLLVAGVSSNLFKIWQAPGTLRTITAKQKESKRVSKNPIALQRLLIFIARLLERHPDF